MGTEIGRGLNPRDRDAEKDRVRQIMGELEMSQRCWGETEAESL